MASYFDEHNCVPLRDGETPDHFLHMARLLLDTGIAVDLEMEFAALNGEKPTPPAGAAAVKALPEIPVTGAQATKEFNCPICLAPYDEGETTKQMPCKHQFHPDCILPWLKKTNSCPVCRLELPTDDRDYEEFKKQKARKKQKEEELEILHNSMFG